MIEDAIVLAGGFGTRLASVVSEVPKPMAPIAGRPFLEHLLDRLSEQGVRRVVLAVGYKHEIIQKYFGASYAGMHLRYSIESTPLGTGGALRQAFEETDLDRALALNGDTYCTADLAAFSSAHSASGCAASLVLVSMSDAGRYGAVEINSAAHISAFREKDPSPNPGLINAGIYALERQVFTLAPAEKKFSFEQAVLQTHAATSGFMGHIAQDALFIDIGVPDDYYRAQTLLGRP